MERDELHGTWLLEAWRQEYDDGRLIEPFGPTPVGAITYSGDRMACIISRPDREPFKSGGQWTGTIEEQAAAYSSCMAYAGSYEVRGDTVVHHVEMSLFPNWVGAEQARRVTLSADRLSLLARLEEGTPEARTARLDWFRAAAVTRS